MTEYQLICYIFPKIAVATVCGMIIGWERELKHKVAGVRTHILVCVGACIYTAVGFILGPQYNVDPSRIIGQIVTGIGFLGAGVIFKQEDRVVGVTSAAFIWLMASIGVLIGCGYLLTTLLLTLGLLGLIIMLHRFELHITKNNTKTTKHD